MESGHGSFTDQPLDVLARYREPIHVLPYRGPRLTRHAVKSLVFVAQIFRCEVRRFGNRRTGSWRGKPTNAK